MHKIHEEYSRFWDLEFKSEKDRNESIKYCYVACQMKNSRQISLFNYFDDESDYDLDKNHEQNIREREASLILSYDNDIDEKNLRVKIANDFKSIIFADFHEKIFIEKKEEYND